MHRDELLKYLAELLVVDEIEDRGINGLQVEGREEIERVVTGVSACAELFERAIELGADAVIVHHGILWQGQDPTIRGVFRRRVKLLLDHDVNLLAYHLPLDKHPEIGNNALAAKAIGLRHLELFAGVGWVGATEPMGVDELVGKVEQLYGQKPLVFPYGSDTVRRIAILSGGGQKYVEEAIDRGADAYITGEAGETVMNLAREAGLHFLAAGHYATERPGIRALGDRLATEFGLEVTFVDIPNPV